jgi:hypothetical protein
MDIRCLWSTTNISKSDMAKEPHIIAGLFPIYSSVGLFLSNSVFSKIGGIGHEDDVLCSGVFSFYGL